MIYPIRKKVGDAMTFLEKLDALMERSGLNRRSLSLKAGIPYTTIDNWYKRGYEGLQLSTAGKLAEFFDTTTDYFLRDDLTDPDYGKAAGFQVDFPEMVLLRQYRALDTYGKRAVNAVLTAEHDRMTHLVEREQKGWITYINLYDLAVSAGTGEPLGDTYYTTRLEIPTEKVPENAHCCLRVNGDSMEPAYKDGDIVFVQRLENGTLREGEVGVFAFNGEGYIKQLGHRQLLSFNPDYPPIPVGPYDRLECQGRVLAKL
jgi:repressor LexA